MPDIIIPDDKQWDALIDAVVLLLRNSIRPMVADALIDRIKADYPNCHIEEKSTSGL